MTTEDQPLQTHAVLESDEAFRPDEPRWHSHPALGIDGHAHGPTVEANLLPHTHRQVAQLDLEPQPID